ncbi:hypothetical protein SAMN05444000_1385 [Shimia gijangensis]|uniref:DNA-binding protein n=1 Tax=Shimia gijangensis TaxID=1470563 RepID=A0A1M6TCN5_9RHOB|nr:hypothetical protein [Shimia gijangensis]SHK54802.1 hypothetical protein SAMN05444000_1385 [Shimia gijangensis]
MARRFKTRSIKANKSYRVPELAEAADVSIATVRNWIKAGMQCVDGNRPTIVMGFQALEFLTARKADAKRPSALDEFFCFRCKATRAALGSMADYEPTSEKGGRLKALCGVCECQCNRNISARDLPQIRKVLEVATRGNR